jgi:hypothetical protein
MAHIYKMKMVSGPLMLKAVWVDGGVDQAQEYGKRIAALI